MKEDILEQLVDDYLKFNGFFTIHNVKFKPSKEDSAYSSKKDSNASDVDVIGLHPKRKGTNRVWVVSCKSWQKGFSPAKRIADIDAMKKVSGREAWQGFRELTVKKWADGLIDEVERLTGSRQFTYITAVTKLKGDASGWLKEPRFRENLRGNPLKILTLQEILTDLYSKTKTTMASSEVGRLLQVIKASGWKP
jgi:hypothetical protein